MANLKTLLDATIGPHSFLLASAVEEQLLGVPADGSDFDRSAASDEMNRVFAAGEASLTIDGGLAVHRLPLRVSAEAVGVLEITISATRSVSSEMWSLLAAQVAVAVRTVQTIRDLRADTVREQTTGLFNARQLRDSLTQELLRGRRFGHPVSILFIDLDHFKRVNDQYGHLAGTALLVAIAERLTQNIRKVDSAYRYGGDEFVLLLVETNRAGARSVAARIQSALAAPFLAATGQPIDVTVSIGVAGYPDDGSEADEILAAADRALYRAKACGRNEVVSTEDLAQTADSADLR